MSKGTKPQAHERAADKPEAFTGVARSVEAFDNQGFTNFRIMTLHLKQGEVERIEYSDPYANFEAIIKLELMNELSIMRLNSRLGTRRGLERLAYVDGTHGAYSCDRFIYALERHHAHAFNIKLNDAKSLVDGELAKMILEFNQYKVIADELFERTTDLKLYKERVDALTVRAGFKF